MSYFTIQSVTLSKNIFAPGEAVTATIKLTALQATKSIKFGLTTVVANASNTNVDTLCAPYVTVTKSIAANASATVKATFTAYNAGASAPSGKTNTFTALGTYGRRASGTVYLIPAAWAFLPEHIFAVYWEKMDTVLRINTPSAYVSSIFFLDFPCCKHDTIFLAERMSRSERPGEVGRS